MKENMKQVTLIILLCLVFSILFGILHNQVSARVSEEYFTIGHRALIQSTSPTLMGIAWGVNSTWWVGLILGVLLALAGRLGNRQRRSAASLIKPLLMLFLVCGTASLLLGFAAYRLSSSGSIPFLKGMTDAIAVHRQPRYMAALWMHTASYTAATMGGLILAVRIVFDRLRKIREESPVHS